MKWNYGCSQSRRPNIAYDQIHQGCLPGAVGAKHKTVIGSLYRPVNGADDSGSLDHDGHVLDFDDRIAHFLITIPTRSSVSSASLVRHTAATETRYWKS